MNPGMKLVVFGFLICAQHCSAAPKKGTDLPPRTDGVEVVNEPCYVHDGACDGYAVCCVKAGTCIGKHSGTISSNLVYYEGGCQSLESSKKEYSEKNKNANCKQQGECMIPFTEACKGGVAKPAMGGDIPQDVWDRMMGDSCELNCDESNYGHRSRAGNGTTTTTTTVLSRYTGTLTLAVSSPGSANAEKMGLMVKRVITLMSGYITKHSKVTVEMPAVAETMTVTYHVDVSSSDTVSHNGPPMTVAYVQEMIESHSTAQINRMLSMMIGSCAYTVTVVESDDTTPASTAARATGMVVALTAAVSAAALS